MMLSIFHRTPSLTDGELMLRVSKNGDDRAFDELYHRHSRRLMGFLLRQLKEDSERASDLTQDTFMRVWSNRERYKPDSDFRTWLFSIAYNLVKNEYRQFDYSAAYSLYIKVTQTETQDENIDIQLDNKAFDEALSKELARLDPANRMLFSLRYEEGLSVPQIAEILDIPQGTVKSRQHSLIQTLKEKLKDYEARR